MKPSNTPGRPSSRTRAPSGSGEARGSPGQCEPHTPNGRQGFQPLPTPQRRCSGSREGWESQMLRRRAKAFTWKPRICRSAPQDACSVHSAQPLPGASASPRRAGGLSFAPASGSPLALGPPGEGLREQRTSGPDGPASGAALAPGRERQAGAGFRVRCLPAMERAAPRAAQPPP